MIIVDEVAPDKEHFEAPGASDHVTIDCFQACRNRLPVESATGRQLFIQLRSEVYLSHDLRLVCADGTSVRVSRPEEPAFCFACADELDSQARQEMCFAIGHRLGNLHLPAEVVDGCVVGPSLAGRDSIERVAEAFKGFLQVTFSARRLGLFRPLHGIRGGHR